MIILRSYIIVNITLILISDLPCSLGIILIVAVSATYEGEMLM